MAGDQIDAFFGTDADFRYCHMVLHYDANLAESAGGVDVFLIGSELRVLTRVRSARVVGIRFQLGRDRRAQSGALSR